jgi:hypothetical protein
LPRITAGNLSAGPRHLHHPCELGAIGTVEITDEPATSEDQDALGRDRETDLVAPGRTG